MRQRKRENKFMNKKEVVDGEKIEIKNKANKIHKWIKN